LVPDDAQVAAHAAVNGIEDVAKIGALGALTVFLPKFFQLWSIPNILQLCYRCDWFVAVATSNSSQVVNHEEAP